MKQYFTLNKDDPNRCIVRSNLSSFIDRLPESKAWRVTVEPYVKARTDAQNHALFGVAYPPLEQATGHTKDELHEAFCRRFFGTVSVEVFGQVVTRPMRTTTTGADGRRDVLDRATFCDFYALVQQVGAEIGVFVPDPDPLAVSA